ncbi:MAG: hypothetical protein CMM01_15970 [Rhodopirellula sp.]|nr:hypothetical protein [Rhodopirellula sp.]
MSFSDSLLVPFSLLLQGETGPRQGTREAVATQQNALRNAPRTEWQSLYPKSSSQDNVRVVIRLADS